MDEELFPRLRTLQDVWDYVWSGYAVTIDARRRVLLGARSAPSLPLALVAAEDQRFPVHHGFDFQAIRKAQVHNERMVERAERRNTPVKHLRGASTISQQTAKNLFLWQGSGPTRWLRKGLEAW